MLANGGERLVAPLLELLVGHSADLALRISDAESPSRGLIQLSQGGFGAFAVKSLLASFVALIFGLLVARLALLGALLQELLSVVIAWRWRG